MFFTIVRKKKIKFANMNYKHQATYVFSGDPEGSILGPLLFSIFINYFAKVVSFSRLLLVADNLKYFFTY